MEDPDLRPRRSLRQESDFVKAGNPDPALSWFRGFVTEAANRLSQNMTVFVDPENKKPP